MNILIISALADSSGLGVRLKAEGHNVLYYIHMDAEKETCDGILDKVDDWREHVDWADLIIFDDVDQKEPGESAYQGGKWYEELRQKYPDKAIIGGSSWASKLENDRMFGQEVLQACGVPTVPMHRFEDFEDAIAFVSKEGGAWALKHNGQVNRALAHVSFDPEDMIEYLEWLDEHWNVLAPGHKPDFVLQQAIKGIELAVTCFFDGEKFREDTCYLNQERKRFMPGDEGPPTGQMGAVDIPVPNARLFQAVLKPTEPLFRENGVCQFVDVNCIIASPDTVVPLEWTVRPGYPTIYSMIEAADEPIGQMLYKLATRSPEPVRMYPGFVVTVVMATNKFPYTDPLNRFCYLRGVEKTGLRHVHLCAVKYEKGQLRGADDSGYLAVVTGRGRTIEEARRKAYSIVDQLEIVPFALYREDIGDERVQEEFRKLAEWGWLS
ncbi:hypothetical protein HPY42_06505 [Coprothermobacteraceae bacterium]|nr:hypothetical protein [Coprothermobacteraceae bacterium]